MPEASLTVRVQLEAASKIAEQAARDVAALGRLKAAAAAVAVPSQLMRGAAAAAGAVGSVATLPRMLPPPSLVPRPDMGRGVFGGSAGMPPGVQEAVRAQEQLNQARQRGLPAAQKSAELARIQAQAMTAASRQATVATKPKNAWQIDQDRLAALAARQRGDTTQGPQRAGGGGVGAGTVAALAAGGAAAGAAGGGKDVAALLKAGTDRMASEAAAAAAARAGEGAATGESKVTLKARTAAARKRILDAAAEAKKFADSSEKGLQVPNIVTSQNSAVLVARPEAQAQAVLESQRQLGGALAARTRKELLRGDRGKTGTTLSAEYQDEFDRSQMAGVQRRQQEAAENVLVQDRRGKLLKGPEYRQTVAQEAIAASGAGLNQQREQTMGAQAQAAYLGTGAGQKELKETVALRKQEAAAMKQVQWRQSVAELGKFGAGVKKAGEVAKGMEGAVFNALAFRVAQIGLLVNAASPSAIATFTDSATLAGIALGKSLVPSVDAASYGLQKFARWWDKDVPNVVKGGSTAVGVGSVVGLAGLFVVLKGLQGIAAIGRGVAAVRGFFAGSTAAQAAAANYPASMGPGAVASRAPWGLAVPVVAAAAVGQVLALSLEAQAGTINKREEELGGAGRGITRKEFEESPAYKQLQALPEGERKQAADDQAAAAKKEYLAAVKRSEELSQGWGFGDYHGPSWLLRQAGVLGPSRAEKAQTEQLEAQKRYELAQKAREELVQGIKFEQPAQNEAERKAQEAAKQDAMLRSLRGLPQARYTTGAEWDDAATLAALTSSSRGGAEAKIQAEQLDILTGVLGKLDAQLDELKKLNLNPIARRDP